MQPYSPQPRQQRWTLRPLPIRRWADVLHTRCSSVQVLAEISIRPVVSDRRLRPPSLQEGDTAAPKSAAAAAATQQHTPAGVEASLDGSTAPSAAQPVDGAAVPAEADMAEAQPVEQRPRTPQAPQPPQQPVASHAGASNGTEDRAGGAPRSSSPATAVCPLCLGIMQSLDVSGGGLTLEQRRGGAAVALPDRDAGGGSWLLAADGSPGGLASIIR